MRGGVCSSHVVGGAATGGATRWDERVGVCGCAVRGGAVLADLALGVGSFSELGLKSKKEGPGSLESGLLANFLLSVCLVGLGGSGWTLMLCVVLLLCASEAADRAI